MTNLTARPSISTIISSRQGVMSDLGYGLDELFNIMTDEDNNRILFHTGDFYSSETIITSRPLIP